MANITGRERKRDMKKGFLVKTPKRKKGPREKDALKLKFHGGNKGGGAFRSSKGGGVVAA